MTSWLLFALWLPLLLPGCMRGAPKTSRVTVQPSLIIEVIEVEDPAGAKSLPAGNKLSPGQGFAVRLRTQGFIQIVEEQTAGGLNFLVRADADALNEAGSVRIPATGFLRSSAAAQSICLVASSKPLIQPSCAEDDGRGEDRSPPAAPPPKEDKSSAPPPPTRDDNKTRSPDEIRLVRRLSVSS